MSKGGLTPDLKILRGEEFSRSGSYMFIGRRSRRGVSVLEAASADLWIIRGRKDEPRHAQLQRAGALCLAELMGPGLKCAPFHLVPTGPTERRFVLEGELVQ